MTDCQEQDGQCPTRGELCLGCITIDAFADDDDGDDGVDEDDDDDDDDSLDNPNEDEGGEEIDASFLNYCALH